MPISPELAYEPPPRRSANIPKDEAGVSSLTILPFYSDGHLRNLCFMKLSSISLSLSGLVTVTITALPTVFDVR